MEELEQQHRQRQQQFYQRQQEREEERLRQQDQQQQQQVQQVQQVHQPNYNQYPPNQSTQYNYQDSQAPPPYQQQQQLQLQQHAIPPEYQQQQYYYNNHHQQQQQHQSNAYPPEYAPQEPTVIDAQVTVDPNANNNNKDDDDDDDDDDTDDGKFIRIMKWSCTPLQFMIFISSFFLLGIGTAVVLYLVLSNRNGDENNNNNINTTPTLNPTSTPVLVITPTRPPSPQTPEPTFIAITSSPTTEEEKNNNLNNLSEEMLIVYQTLLDMGRLLFSNDDDINLFDQYIDPEQTWADPSSPQYSAIEWLANVDEWEPTISDGSLSNNGLNVIALWNNDDIDVLYTFHFVERFVMMTFYYAFVGSSWLDDTNFASMTTSICFWRTFNNQGIACNDYGLVKEIRFDENELIGTIPIELGLLQSLETFRINHNFMVGTIPDGWFDMSANAYTVTPFNTILQMKNNVNGITTTPSNIPRIAYPLRDFDVLDNYLSGTIPYSVTELSLSLEYFILIDNFFISQGDTDNTITRKRRRTMTTTTEMTKTKTTSHNTKNHTISRSTIGLQQTNDDEEQDDVDDSSIITFPSHVLQLTNLYFLSFDRNDFRGILPNENDIKWTTTYRNPKLVYFGVSYNDLHHNNNNDGTTNDGTGTDYMSLHGIANAYRGEDDGETEDEFDIDGYPIPKNGLRTLYFNDNYLLSGTLPTSLIQLTDLDTLDISSTLLYGTVPTQYRSFEMLNDVELYNVSLTGNVNDIFCTTDGTTNGNTMWEVLTMDCNTNPIQVLCSCCTNC